MRSSFICAESNVAPKQLLHTGHARNAGILQQLLGITARCEDTLFLQENLDSNPISNGVKSLELDS